MGNGVRRARRTTIVLVMLASLVPLATRTEATPAVQNFEHVGSFEVTVPAGVTRMTIDAAGASGGGWSQFDAAGPGRGGRVQATIGVVPLEVLQINIGGSGADGDAALSGGFNGGGLSVAGGGSLGVGGGGGGATDIRRGAFGLEDRLVVAGGGGGAGHTTNLEPNAKGGAGGHAGGDGVPSGVDEPGGQGGANGGAGGHPDAGGVDGEPGQPGVGGDSSAALAYSGGGGGGGWMGGGGGAGTDVPNTQRTGGGGGGSSRVNTPTAGSVTYTDGVNDRDGWMKIAYNDPAGRSVWTADFPNLLSGMTIPDGTGPCGFAPSSTLDLTVDLSDIPGVVTDVAVTFGVTHPAVGELVVDLAAPGGASETIFGRTGATTPTSCGDDSNLDGSYTFSDEAPASPTFWEAAAGVTPSQNVPTSPHRASTLGGGIGGGGGANSSLADAFSGSSPNGTWTLSFADIANGNTLGVVSWAQLVITTVNLADLVVGDSPSIAHSCGRTCVVSGLEIDNRGAQNVPRRSRKKRRRAPIVELFRSQADVDTHTVWGRARLSQGIPAGGTLPVNVKVSSGPPPLEVIVVLDGTNKVVEISETNNKDTLTLP